MRVDLHGLVALVTGAGQGMGRAIALGFAQKGVVLALNDIPSSCPLPPREGAAVSGGR
jgi:3-oxoacyl-[acyl-carrier protein] reductase